MSSHIRYITVVYHSITHTSDDVHVISYTAKAAELERELERRKARQALLEAQRDAQLKRAAKLNIRIPNRAKGACWYRLVSQHLYGTERYHKRVRENIIGIIKQNPEYFSQFMGMHVDNYLAEHSKLSQWADEVVILATAILLDRPIMVYCDSLKYPVPKTYYPFGDGDADMSDPLLVWRSGEVHFEAMQPKLQSDDESAISGLSGEDNDNEDDSNTILPNSEASEESVASSFGSDDDFMSAMSENDEDGSDKVDNDDVITIDDDDDTLHEDGSDKLDDDLLDNDDVIIEDDGDSYSSSESDSVKDDEDSFSSPQIETDLNANALNIRNGAVEIMQRVDNRNLSDRWNNVDEESAELNHKGLLDSVKNATDGFKSFFGMSGKTIFYLKYHMLIHLILTHQILNLPILHSSKG